MPRIALCLLSLAFGIVVSVSPRLQAQQAPAPPTVDFSFRADGSRWFGATLAARVHGIPLILDGFVSTSAAAPLARLGSGGLAHVLAGHVSAEAGHRRLLEKLGLKPLLDLGMRLGEGSGAAVAINVVRAALACHAGMATFAEASVSEK